jgi:SAM-dependent methyltransferase
VSTSQGDYVLATTDAEIDRLGLQHRVWRRPMLEACRRAGLQEGWRVVDVGAGPGYATWELAERVGRSGEVLAVERSPRFASRIDAEARRRGLAQVRVQEGDLMSTPAPDSFDMTWCRWVASFTPSVPRLVSWIRDALRPGGVAVFHEYVDYGSWRFAPPRPRLADFVAKVVESWRAEGGEPDVAPLLIDALARQGFQLRSMQPYVFAARPGEPEWQWPAAFVQTGASRLLELGRVSAAWVDEVLRELEAARSDPAGIMVTPLVLEVIAERR